MSGALVSVGGILVPPDVACVAVVDKLVAGLVAKGVDRDAARRHVDAFVAPLLVAVIRNGVDPLEAMSELMSMTGAAGRERRRGGWCPGPPWPCLSIPPFSITPTEGRKRDDVGELDEAIPSTRSVVV